jgi:hypothetical protein
VHPLKSVSIGGRPFDVLVYNTGAWKYDDRDNNAILAIDGNGGAKLYTRREHQAAE